MSSNDVQLRLIHRLSNVNYDLELEEAEPTVAQHYRVPRHPLAFEHIYGHQAFSSLPIPWIHHASFSISGVGAAMVSAIFATGTIDWLAGLLEPNFPDLAKSDLLAIIGLFTATPGFLLFRGGTQNTIEEILKRFKGFRWYDLLSFGVTRRWYSEAYNHYDSKSIYFIEALVLFIAQFSILISPASGLSLANRVVDDKNYILVKLIPHNHALRLIIASIGGYAAVAVINGNNFSRLVDSFLNKIANQIADAPDIAKKRSEITKYLSRLVNANFDAIEDKRLFLQELNNYRRLMHDNGGIVLLEAQIVQILRMQKSCKIQAAQAYWNISTILPYIGAVGLSSIATVPTMVLANSLIKARWFAMLTNGLTGWPICGLGAYLGFIAGAVSWPLNFFSCVDVLGKAINLISHPSQLILSMKDMDYYDWRNQIITLVFSLLSATIAFTLAMNSSLTLDPECSSYLGFMQPVLKIAFPILNTILPGANFGVSFALAFKSINEFLNEQLLITFIAMLRNAYSLAGLYNPDGDPHYQRRLWEASVKSLKDELERIIEYLKRAPSHQIEKLASLEALQAFDEEDSSPADAVSQSQNRYGSFSPMVIRPVQLAHHAEVNRPSTWREKIRCNIM